jgi:hypothetical protein
MKRKVRRAKRSFQIFMGTLILPIQLMAQAPTPPLPVEVLFGNNQLYFQMVVKRKFTPQRKFDFFTVASFTTDYSTDPLKTSLVLPVQLSYQIGKGFGLMAGADVNSATGVAPIVGPQHTYASKTFLAVTIVSFFANATHDVKWFGMYEYKPPLNDKWSFYTRLQFLYNQNLRESIHNRSYAYLRLGVRTKALTFGAAANLDQFGPMRVFADNYGLFVRWEF